MLQYLFTNDTKKRMLICNELTMGTLFSQKMSINYKISGLFRDYKGQEAILPKLGCQIRRFLALSAIKRQKKIVKNEKNARSK